MFDWNNEELVNIIWGEADASDDHIVPFPNGTEGRPAKSYGDHIKKEWNEEISNVKSTGLRIPDTKSEISREKLKKSTQDEINEQLDAGLGAGSCIDLSSSNAAMDETAVQQNGSVTFQNQNEDKDNSELVDYDWANIGSFDDLDRIFSNNDPIFGNVSLGNADELWCSSKDVTSSPDTSAFLSMDCPSLEHTELRSTSKHHRKGDFMVDQDQPSIPSYEKINDNTYSVPQRITTNMDNLGSAEISNKIFTNEEVAMEMVNNYQPLNTSFFTGSVGAPTDYTKMSRKKKCLNSHQKSEDKNDGRPLQDLFGTCSSSGSQCLQLDSQYMQIRHTSPYMGCQMQIQELESPQYKNFSTPLLAPTLNVNTGTHDPSVSVLPWFRYGKDSQNVASDSNISSVKSNIFNSFPETPVSSLAMTPQEKIEKLRRRQQMRAMLAIQKQQQQFTHQTSSTENSVSQKYSDGDQLQLVNDKSFGVHDYPSTFAFPEPNPPTAQDDSGTISATIDNCSLEETILYRLQKIVSKLDIQLRLCIRDSLLRLAQGAVQRQFSKDMGSTNTSSNADIEFLAKKEAHDSRFDKMTEVETDTNPIDRTVAHLLFHRPIESLGKLLETPDSPASNKVPCERKSTRSLCAPNGVWLDNSETQSHLVSKSSVNPEGEDLKTISSHLNASGNACSKSDAEHGATKREAS